MRLILLGPPGGGKGTQGKRLAQIYGIPHIATGEMIREQIALRTAFGCRIEAAISAGSFAPDAEMIGWIAERLEAPDAHRGYVLDGFPRTLGQACAFSETPAGQWLDGVLDLYVSDGVLLERLSGRWVCPQCERVYHECLAMPQVAGQCDGDNVPLVRRRDDSGETIWERLRVYERLTLPLRSYYKTQGLLLAIDANGGTDSVHQAIVRRLQELPSGYKNAGLEV